MFADAFDWLGGHPWFFVGLLLCVIGMGMEYVFKAYRDKQRPEPPKPRTYRVVIEADDGWPLRTYGLPSDAAARLVRDLDRNRGYLD